MNRKEPSLSKQIAAIKRQLNFLDAQDELSWDHPTRMQYESLQDLLRKLQSRNVMKMAPKPLSRGQMGKAKKPADTKPPKPRFVVRPIEDEN